MNTYHLKPLNALLRLGFFFIFIYVPFILFIHSFVLCDWNVCLFTLSIHSTRVCVPMPIMIWYIYAMLFLVFNTSTDSATKKERKGEQEWDDHALRPAIIQIDVYVSIAHSQVHWMFNGTTTTKNARKKSKEKCGRHLEQWIKFCLKSVVVDTNSKCSTATGNM